MVGRGCIAPLALPALFGADAGARLLPRRVGRRLVSCGGFARERDEVSGWWRRAVFPTGLLAAGGWWRSASWCLCRGRRGCMVGGGGGPARSRLRLQALIGGTRLPQWWGWSLVAALHCPSGCDSASGRADAEHWTIRHCSFCNRPAFQDFFRVLWPPGVSAGTPQRRMSGTCSLKLRLARLGTW